MYLADTHMHSTVSFDGHHSRRTMAESSLAFGLDAICFTDHYDVVNEEGRYTPHYDWAPARRAQIQAREVKGLEVLYGLELGNAPVDWSAANRALEEPGLDMVIGSIHNTSKPLGWMDYYYVDYSAQPHLCAPHLQDYLEQMLALAHWGNYDTLGHLPYPLRYMRDKHHQPVSFQPYSDLVEDILREAAQQGKALEVNTNRGRTPLDDYLPLLRQFRGLGGEFVTVGADAHCREDVGLGVREALPLLEEAGFRYVTIFRDRTPHPVKR